MRKSMGRQGSKWMRIFMNMEPIISGNVSREEWSRVRAMVQEFIEDLP